MLQERAERLLLCARHWAELWRKNEVDVSWLLSLWNSDWWGVRQANALIKKSGSVTPGPSVTIVHRETQEGFREGVAFELGVEGWKGVLPGVKWQIRVEDCRLSQNRSRFWGLGQMSVEQVLTPRHYFPISQFCRCSLKVETWSWTAFVFFKSCLECKNR